MKIYELYQQKGWIQKNWARDDNGQILDMFDSCATKYCFRGAYEVAYLNSPRVERQEVLDKIYNKISELGFHGILSYNDHFARTKEEVVALCKELDV